MTGSLVDRAKLWWWKTRPTLTRQRLTTGALVGVVALTVVVLLVSLTRPGGGAAALLRGRVEPPAQDSVVLYSSVDAPFLELVVSRFTQETGIKVRLVTDTEATKTFGLVQRLLSEKDRPRADVWWSSEPVGTIDLARAGVLEPYASRAEADFEGGWPAGLRATDQTWYGFANRARVIAYSTTRLSEAQAPRTLRALTDPRWRGRVGMARPQFGTTRTHLAALVAVHGVGPVKEWLEAMVANDVRLYDGNAAVVRAIADGEIDVGLTDTDDVWAGQRNQWPVGLVYEATDAQFIKPDPRARNRPVPPARPVEGLPSAGPLLIPNTVARVRAGPAPAAAARLIDYLLSEDVERALAESDSRNIPVRPALAAEFKQLAVPSPMEVDFARVAEQVPTALRLAEEVLGTTGGG